MNSLDLPRLWEIFWQFALISLLAFGGGQAVLPLIERVSVSQHNWTSTQTFASGVGFGYLIPGPVTTMATFIGYQAGGVMGALAATFGMFLAPMTLAALAAAGVERFAQNRWVRAFSAGAAPAIVGLLGATLIHSAYQSLTNWYLGALALAGLLLTSLTKINPVWILLGGAAMGWIFWTLFSAT